MEQIDRQELDRLAAEYRYIVTDMICRAGSGHIGGALSLIEVIITLYYRTMKIDPSNPQWPQRDRLVMSKGHAAPVLYAALAYKGYFPAGWLPTMNTDGTRLPSHADARTVPGVDATTGSLGQGISVACGMALAAKMNAMPHTVFCVIGDGESNEGQVWEAAMYAAHNKLDNLVVICDYNKLQIDGFTRDILDLEPLVDKWKAFGWEVFETDGHDWDDLYEKINAAVKVRSKPAMVIAHTIKGKDCCMVENKPESHNIKVSDQEMHGKFMAALKQNQIDLPY